MILRRPRALATALLLTLVTLLHPSSAESATKKAPRRKSAPSRRARRPPAPPLETASGSTLQERLASLVNGSVSRSSETSIQIVEIDSGTVVAERNPTTPLAPASNMKLFTTAAAIDLLKPSFERWLDHCERVAAGHKLPGWIVHPGDLDQDVAKPGRITLLGAVIA